MKDGEVLLGYSAHALELSRITGKKVTPKQAQHWSKRGVYRTKKVGHFRSATRGSIAEDLSPRSEDTAA